MNDKLKLISEKSFETLLSDYFTKSSEAIKGVSQNLNLIKSMAMGIYMSQLNGGNLLVCGNGGSCSDAEHFVGEMTCTFKDRDRRAFSAVSLSGSAAEMTAWSNDFGFDSYFCRQVEAIGRPGDILVLISTSGGDRSTGGSMNVVKAAEKALKMGIKCYALLGKEGGELSKIVSDNIKVPSLVTSHIQEAHISIIHAICLLVDEWEKLGKSGEVNGHEQAVPYTMDTFTDN